MDYRIALPPDMNISPAEFAAAWNEDPECQGIAEAHTEEESGRQMDPLTVGGAILTGVAVGVAGSATYEVLKAGFTRVLAKLGINRSVEITEPSHPPGTPAGLVIVVKE